MRLRGVALLRATFQLILRHYPQSRGNMKIIYTFLLVPLATLDCGGPASQSTESLSTTNEALYGNGTFVNPGADTSYISILWPSGTVPVCFPPDGNNTASLMLRTREILQDTWSRVAGLSFTGWNVCSDNVAANHPNTLAITFPAGIGGTTDSPAGPHQGGWINSRVGRDADGLQFRLNVVHEVGHALGFQHDQDRPDNWTGGPGNWHSVYCPSDHTGTAGPIVGGFSYGPPDNDSVMSYCNPTGTLFNNKGHLSAIDVAGVRIAYPFRGGGTIAKRDLPNFPAERGLLNCQYLTDTYGGISNPIGYDPPNVHQLWTDWRCFVTPQFDTNTLCQTASDLYGVNASVTFGYATNAVQTWWKGHNCNTKPLITEDICQRASDTYGIIGGYTFGTAPSEVQSWWSDPARGNCQTKPRNPDSCQHFSDLYGTVINGDLGWAPTAALSWWSAHGCKTSPTTGSTTDNKCQQLSDTYAMAPGNVAFAPTEAQTWWSHNGTGTGCTTVPQSLNACQKAADLYYITPSVDFGAAPSNARTWWSNTGCNTLTRFSKRACADAASRYGIIGGVSFGFAPPEVQTWWSGTGGCNAVPSGPQPLPG
jgi:hypothetical protein